MNDFEQQLRQWKPAPPSNDLMVRLQLARPFRPLKSGNRWWNRALPVATAAGIVVLVGKLHHPPAVVPPVAQYLPVEAENFMLGVKQVGITHTENGVPYRLLQCIGVRREIWQKTSDGSQVAVVVPQQEIILAQMDMY